MAVEAEEIDLVEEERALDETSALDELQKQLDGEPEDDSEESTKPNKSKAMMIPPTTIPLTKRQRLPSQSRK